MFKFYMQNGKAKNTLATRYIEPKTKKKGLFARVFGTSEGIDVDSDGVIMEGEDLLEEMFEDE